MAQDIELTSDLLTPNTISLRGASLKYAFKPLTKTNPLTNSFEIAETQTNGFENPKIIIHGYIDTNNLTDDLVQQKHLLALAKNEYDGTESTSIYLTVKTGKEDEALLAMNGTTETIKVCVEAFDIGIDTESDLAHFWVYQLTLVETA